MSEKIKILFPIDFSEQTDVSWPTAQYIARTYDADIYLQVTLEPPTGPFKVFASFDEEGARKEAGLMLDRFISSQGDPAITFHKLIKVGKPYKTIVQAAEELEINAIVMGTHGASGAKEIFVGSNASRVITTAPCPVITMQTKPKGPGFNKILLPLDLTKETGEKLELGIEFAQNFKASLVVLSILETSDEDAKKRLQRRMQQAVALIKKNDVDADATMLQTKGNIADLVVQYAEEIEADLIVVMTQQELDFRHTFLGANASHVVNHSSVPVLSIKPKKEYRTRHYSGSHFG